MYRSFFEKILKLSPAREFVFELRVTFHLEFLIAAGFELGAIDDVPCYLSKEPNIETDMDGWAAWFDLLKGTLDVLEQEMSKLPKRP